MNTETSPIHASHDAQHPPPTVLVVGTGAIGGYYGAQLAKGGARVSTTHRSDFDTVRQHGIQIDSIHGPHHFTPERVLRQVTDYAAFPDYLVVGLKVLEEIATVEMIRPVVGPATTILLLQNGVEIEDPIAQAFPDNELLSGLAFICVSRIAPGQIRHTCYGHLTMGRFPHGPSPAAERLAHHFRAAGIPCSITETIARDRWKKLVWNAAFNPLSVLTQATTQEILAHPPSAQLVRQIMEEVCLVATAAGHPIDERVIQKNLDATKRMKPYKTSMLIDYLQKRSMEVEAILGNPIRCAERLQIDLPHMRTLYAILSLAAGRRQA